MNAHGLIARLRALLFRARADAELDEELRFHLDAEAARNVAAGMSPDDARYVAQRAFGNASHHKDAARDAWGLRWLETLAQDVRFALRSFRRSPAFVVTVVATIALALGLNTTAFTIFNAYVLRPIRVRDPYSLYQFSYHDARNRWHGLTSDDYDALRAFRPSAQSFAYQNAFARIDGIATFGVLASGNAFQVLGARAHIGRTLLPEDKNDAVMVLSYDMWRSRFGADSGIVGHTLRIRGVPLQVVGVLSSDFQGIGAVPPDFWAPIELTGQLAAAPSRSARATIRAVIRLRPGEAESQARAQLTTWAERLTAQRPDSDRAASVDLISMANALPQDNSETWLMFMPIFVAFGLVMLIACANVANMMLARALARQREIGIRLALGAERARLIRQLLTESVLLAIPAAVAGFVLSGWTIDAGVRAMFASLPAEFVPYVRIVPLAPDARVFVFILAASLAAALLFGLVPAIQATRPNIVQASRGDFDTAFRPGRLRAGLLVAQITVCAVLLITTGLLLRGAHAARGAATGILTGNVVNIVPDERGRAATIQKLRTHALVDELAASFFSPLDGMYPSIPMRAHPEGKALGNDRVEQVAYDFVSGNYFATLGVPLLRGRSFTESEERAGAQVAIVSAATAQRLWPGEDAVGQLLWIATDVPRESKLAGVRSARVVGVTGNTVTGWIGTGLTRSVAYYPARLEDAGVRILARVRGDQTRARDQLDTEIDAALARSPLEQIHTLDDFLAVQRYPFRAFSWVSTAIGCIALLLTVTGIYGVLSYLVTQRTKEIGIRIALVANIREVTGMVVRQTTRFAVIGIAAGMLLALGVSRVMASVLWIVNGYDALGYAGGILVVFAAALVAAYAPARRAARVDPLTALREE